MRASHSTFALGAASLAMALLAAGPSSATSLKVDYDISLAGLPLGSADLSSEFEGSKYKLQLEARLTGLAGLLTRGGGAATAAGSVATAQPLPHSFSVISRNASEQRSVRMGLASGNVVQVDINPPLDQKADRVPVKEIHKRGIVDPVSALVMPSLGRSNSVDPVQCNRTIPVFDGAARFNVVLAYAETKTVDKAGYKGPVLVCNARYVPIAGHRSERAATKFMEENRDMSVWLAPVDGARVFVPLRIAVKTLAGTSVIEASRWAVRQDGRSGPGFTRTSAPLE